MRTFASQLAARRREIAFPGDDANQPVGQLPARLDVIGAGFGRTGTMSLKLALEQLGFGPCYHMTEIAQNPGHARFWRMAHSGQPVDWTDLFSHYRSTADWPACHFYRELMAAFPAAKVILTLRDSGQWYESMANTLYSLKTAADARLLARQERLGYASAPAPGNWIWNETFSGRFKDRAYAISVFEQHNAEVMMAVPADRLLVYRVSEQWGPLCDFLGVEPPGQPFPSINSTQSFREYNRMQLGQP